VNVSIGNASSNDTVTISSPGWSLGIIATGGNYIDSTRTVTANVALSGASLTLTFTSTAPAGQLNVVTSSTMVWTPSASAADPAGNPMLATPRTQTGAPKRNF
jgi:hypothetical protein